MYPNRDVEGAGVGAKIVCVVVHKAPVGAKLGADVVGLWEGADVVGL